MRPRECFIIDPDGTIQTMEMMTPPVERKLIRTARRIQAFWHIHATKARRPPQPV
jgi:peroxiredoxin (alkyl hydroperoxide reductase subunit C)